MSNTKITWNKLHLLNNDIQSIPKCSIFETVNSELSRENLHLGFIVIPLLYQALWHWFKVVENITGVIGLKANHQIHKKQLFPNSNATREQ